MVVLTGVGNCEVQVHFREEGLRAQGFVVGARGEVQPVGAAGDPLGAKVLDPAVGVGFALAYQGPVVAVADLKYDGYTGRRATGTGVEDMGGDL